MKTLTERALNRALLARQLLLERVELPVPEAMERMGAVQTQYAPSGYIGLWSRLEGFQRADLTGALERREAAQGTLMRVTIHTASAADYPVVNAGVRDTRRLWWFRTLGKGVPEADVAAAAERLRGLLADGPRRAAELREALGPQLWSGAGLWLELVRVPPSGTWERRRADLYAVAEDWLGPSSATAEDGVDLLLRRYLGAFGPAPARDVANWAGLPVATVRAAIGRAELEPFRDEDGRELVDLPGAPLPDPDTPAPVRFLPTWDATTLAHARRTGLLPEPYRKLVYNNTNPTSIGTFLVDGAVAGTWRPREGRIELHPFRPLPAAVRREVDDEAARLEAFHR